MKKNYYNLFADLNPKTSEVFYFVTLLSAITVFPDVFSQLITDSEIELYAAIYYVSLLLFIPSLTLGVFSHVATHRQSDVSLFLLISLSLIVFIQLFAEGVHQLEFSLILVGTYELLIIWKLLRGKYNPEIFIEETYPTNRFAIVLLFFGIGVTACVAYLFYHTDFIEYWFTAVFMTQIIWQFTEVILRKIRDIFLSYNT